VRGSGVGLPVSPREAAPWWAALALVGAAAWVYTIGQARDIGAGPGTMGMTFSFFVGMWVVMMAAMMLPAIGPQAAGETLALGRSADVTSRIAGVLSFGAGFLIPWAAYGVLAFFALKGTGHLAESSPGVAKWLGVAIFAVAGVYQVSRLKYRALVHCRMVMSHATSDGSITRSVVSGARDGAMCVGCCWAIMAVFFAVGVMNVLAMALLAALIFVEKIAPRPRTVAGVGGVAFVGLAIAAAVHPSLLSGLHLGGMTMPGGM